MNRLKLLFEWLLDFIATHPEWLKSYKESNNSDKNKKNPEMEHLKSEAKTDWGPFKRIPNVSKFKIKLGKKDQLMAVFGIEKKFSPEISYDLYKNQQLNKYAAYQIKRLRHFARTDAKLYFVTVRNLLRYSKVFFILGLNHVAPRWHREIELWRVINLYKSYQKIAQLGAWDVKHYRLYIDKANGKKRPLGVPGMVWRIYLHLVSSFLSIYLEERKFFKQGSQHGFRTGLGTKTAWEKILTEVTKADWVFEFDLERCFSNIHIKGVSKALREAEVPQGWINKFEYLNKVPVQNPKDLRWDTREGNEVNKFLESRGASSSSLQQTRVEDAMKNVPVECQQAYAEGRNYYEWHEDGEVYRYYMLDYIKPNHMCIMVRKKIAENSWATILDLYEMIPLTEWTIIRKGKGTESDLNRGLPQGLPTSPLLTISSLQTNFINKIPWKVIMYADDGIIYGNGQAPEAKELLVMSNEKLGISFNEEKSGFVKLPNTELDLKFLGMRLKGNTLRAETRKGATLEYDKHNLVDILDMLDKYIYDIMIDSAGHYLVERQTADTWEKLVRSKIWGLLQARMFQDSWNIDTIQCFDLSRKKGSWVAKREWKYEDISVFNSTSFACHDLLNTLSNIRHIGRGKAA